MGQILLKLSSKRFFGNCKLEILIHNKIKHV